MGVNVGEAESSVGGYREEDGERERERRMVG